MMKRILLLSTFFSLFLVGELIGQTIEKRWLIGGSYAMIKDNEIIFRPDFPFDIDINIGYRLNQHFTVGLRPEFHYKEFRGTFNNPPKQLGWIERTIGINGFLRGNLLIKRRWHFVMELSYGYKHIDSNGIWREGYYHIANYGFGFNFFFSDTLALETLLTINAEDVIDAGLFYKTGGNDFRIGLQFFL